eukprot:1503312-Amphidinium_carterae.2
MVGKRRHANATVGLELDGEWVLCPCEAVIQERTQRYMQTAQETLRHWSEIHPREYNFKRIAQEVRSIEALTALDLINFAEDPQMIRSCCPKMYRASTHRDLLREGCTVGKPATTSSLKMTRGLLASRWAEAEEGEHSYSRHKRRERRHHRGCP